MIVPETGDEVPLVTAVKTTKMAPKPSPRGRKARKKRPIAYAESPGASKHEVSTAEPSSILATLSGVSGRRMEPEETPVQRLAEEGKLEKLKKADVGIAPVLPRGRGGNLPPPSPTSTNNSVTTMHHPLRPVYHFLRRFPWPAIESRRDGC